MAKAYDKVMATIRRGIENAARKVRLLELWAVAGNGESIHRYSPVLDLHR
jgi:hypothetical protein